MNAIKKIFYILLLLVTFVFSTNSLADSVDKVTKNEVVGDSCKIAKFAVSNNILYICSYNTDSRSTAEALEPFVRRCNEIEPSRQVIIESMECTSIKEVFSYKRKMKGILGKYMADGHAPALIVLIGR